MTWKWVTIIRKSQLLSRTCSELNSSDCSQQWIDVYLHFDYSSKFIEVSIPSVASGDRWLKILPLLSNQPQNVYVCTFPRRPTLVPNKKSHLTLKYEQHWLLMLINWMEWIDQWHLTRFVFVQFPLLIGTRVLFQLTWEWVKVMVFHVKFRGDY